MKKKIYTTLTLLFLMSIFGGVYNVAFSENSNLVKISEQNIQAQPKQQAKSTTTKPQTTQSSQNNQTKQQVISATSLSIVAAPEKYLNKTVKMQATFDKFSTLGLDYSKALRKSTDYIGILIQRDDVVGHNIPLSEMKLFLTKSMAEKHIDLDTGDKLEITAKVFSTALNDPWLDITDLKVISKAKKDEEKN